MMKTFRGGGGGGGGNEQAKERASQRMECLLRLVVARGYYIEGKKTRACYWPFAARIYMCCCCWTLASREMQSDMMWSVGRRRRAEDVGTHRERKFTNVRVSPRAREITRRTSNGRRIASRCLSQKFPASAASCPRPLSVKTLPSYYILFLFRARSLRRIGPTTRGNNARWFYW